MKRFTMLILLAALALPAMAQQINGVPNGLRPTQIPLGTGYNVGQAFSVGNGASNTDCTTGGGTTPVLCLWNGSSWVAIGSGGGTSVTVNSQSCTLGSSCTIPFQTNGSGNNSQAGISLNTSTVNAVGLTITPTNTGTNVETFEITGNSYTGNAATATNPATPPWSIANGGTGTVSALTGLVRGGASAFTAAELSGDATTSGSNVVTVIQVNGAAPPTSTNAVGTNSTGQIVAAGSLQGGQQFIIRTSLGQMIMNDAKATLLPACGSLRIVNCRTRTFN